VEAALPGNSFVALMFGCGVFACVWVWSNLLLDPEQPPAGLSCAADRLEGVLYACIAGGLATLLGASTLWTGHEPIWSAEAIALAAAACTLLAYQRKTEIWMSLATVLSMLASTIFVLHFNQGQPVADVALLAGHVNLLVLGVFSLARIALHRFLAPPSVELSRLWQLPVQIALGMAGNVLVLFVALIALVYRLNLPEFYADWACWPALL